MALNQRENGKGPAWNAHKPSEQDRLKVLQLAATGTPQALIAKQVGLSCPKALRANYRAELDEGKNLDLARLERRVTTLSEQNTHLPVALRATTFALSTRHGISEEHRLRAVVDQTDQDEETKDARLDDWFDQKIAQFDSVIEKNPSPHDRDPIDATSDGDGDGDGDALWQVPEPEPPEPVEPVSAPEPPQEPQVVQPEPVAPEPEPEPPVEPSEAQSDADDDLQVLLARAQALLDD